MRLVVIACVMATSAVASAERQPVVSLGGILAAEPVDPALMITPKRFAGGRVTLSFEEPFLEYPLITGATASARVVPELFASVLADDVRADGAIGAGVRAELQVASISKPPLKTMRVRVAFYVAARAELIGDKREGAFELVFGEYLPFASDRARIGIEAGALVRPERDDMSTTPSLVANLYLGFRL